jgi:hypothetical protein
VDTYKYSDYRESVKVGDEVERYGLPAGWCPGWWASFDRSQQASWGADRVPGRALRANGDLKWTPLKLACIDLVTWFPARVREIV